MERMKMDDDLRQIHEASMEILEQCGVIFHHPEVLEALKQNGVRVEGKTAFFSERQVMDWLAKAPSEFKIYARNPKYDMLIGGDEVNCVPGGYGMSKIVELDGTKREVTKEDYINFVKLIQQSDYFKANGGVIVEPEDLVSGTYFPIMMLTALNYSDKTLQGYLGGTEMTEQTMDMLGIVFGGKDKLKAKPRIATIVSTTSPLQYDKTMLETMLVYLKYGQPVILTPATMAGTTGPVTLAGTIALANAETLAGIAAAQMLKEGTPVIYGSASTTADMKSGGIAIGAPESALCAVYCARLAKAYNLPCRGGGTLTDAKSLSVQSAYEGMMVFLATHQANMNYIIHSAGVMDGYVSFSYEKFIVDLEIIGMVKRFLSGVAVNKDTLAVDVIKEVGPAGEFLTSMHTMLNCRKEPFIPSISLREAIEDDPNKKIIENIENKKKAMLDSYVKPELPEDVQKQLVDYLVGKGFKIELINSML
ncbi:trimethylamine methyltransferase family protein [Desulfosporosinus sp. PR]|uniref:trimethylamine methyltransferase family protein n=1 Tax=Candidatus Desulfosporosinus nitrosoreducens TaxID=3401928 RepID=UPI0027E9A927|nr:trimethylamine methyltransferase family protein [Desulfosporosinus sp. PR]MDQ7095145.1 trimethylamine methyltransferase family protein [Desulfosporosinus sp. PR]